MIYVFIIALILIFVFLYDIRGIKQYKELCYKLTLVILVLLAGLRYRIGIDSTYYCYTFYHRVPYLNVNNLFTDFSYTHNPLWYLLNIFVYSIGCRYYVVQILQAAIVNILIFKYIKKHSQYIFTCVLVYFMWKYPGYCFEELKQSIAVVISLYANDCFFEKKYVKGFALLFTASLFHFSAIIIIFSALALLMNLKLNMKGIIFIFLGIVVGFFLQHHVMSYLWLFDFDDYVFSKADVYATSDMFFAVTNRNFKFYLVNFFMLLAVPASTYFIVKNDEVGSSIFKMESFFVLALFYSVISIFIVITYRIVNYYAIYMVFFIAHASIDIIKKYNPVKFTFIFVFLFLFGYCLVTYMAFGNDRYKKFYPYASIIEKNVNIERERVFNKDKIAPPPDENEY